MSSHLQRVKERLSKYKEDIDVAEEREMAAKAQLVEAETRGANTRNEVEGLKRRLVLVREDLEKVNERLEAAQKKLNRAEGRFGNDDEIRQEFEVTEMERDEQIMALELECDSAKKLKNEAQTVLVDSERKLTVVEEDLQRTYERLRVATERVSSLEDQITNAGTEIRELEDRDNDAAQREELTEEKLKFLEDQLREVDDRAEMGEREVVKLENLVSSYQNELNNERKKTQRVRDEFAEIDAMADEQLQEHSDQPAPRRKEPEAERESESEPEPEPEPEAEKEPEHSEGSEEEPAD